MSEQYIAEIRLVSFNFAPKGWALCDGQTLQINQNQALFALLGTNYGGDGRTTFKLPDLRGRVPLHVGNGFAIQGQVGGEENHTLIGNEMPSHLHQLMGTTTVAAVTTPTGNMLANTPANVYATGGPNTPLIQADVPGVGGSQPHPNMSPYLVLNFVIALQGIFPSRN